MGSILTEYLYGGGVNGMYSREVKFIERVCTTKGHGSFPSTIDAEPRKHGYRSGLETLVVHAVNDECWAN
jgi:hypothetical protein